MAERMIPEELIKDLELLKECGFTFQLIEEGQRVYIVFKDYKLPLGIYNLEQTDLLIFTTQFYPNAGFDMFWVDEALKLKNGSIPKNAEALENYIGRKWRRFSYHPYSTKHWNPSEDGVVSFLGNVEKRLKKGD
jgi:hypothetical protein